MTLARGKWLCWNSSYPRRSGAFIVEIWEKTQPQSKLLQGMKLSAAGMKEMMMKGTNSFSHEDASHREHKIVDRGEILRVGEYFRLRSVKFQDMELGVTNVRQENDFFYMGLAKV